jgi:hypothetical protein
MNIDGLKQEYVPKYIANGEQKFYRSLLFLAMNKLVLMNKGAYKGSPPHLEFMDYHDLFIILYRREGEEVYLMIAKTLRKVAHKVYRIMLKKNMTNANNRFLNLV